MSRADEVYRILPRRMPINRLIELYKCDLVWIHLVVL